MNHDLIMFVQGLSHGVSLCLLLGVMTLFWRWLLAVVFSLAR